MSKMSNSKCAVCGRFLPGTDSAISARCHQCHGAYHRRCVALPPSGSISPAWQCPDCQKNRPARNESVFLTGNSATALPVTDTPQCKSPETTELTNDIMAELRIFRDTLRSINKDLQLFRDDISDIRASLKTQQNHLEHLEGRVCKLEEQPTKCPSKIDDIIAQLKQDLNDHDQSLLDNDVEVANLTEASGENPIHLVMVIASKLGMNLEERDIVSAERVGGRHIAATESSGPEPRPRPLCVRLARRHLRDEMLKNARIRRGATSADLGITGPPKRFYVNERLTKCNRQLFHMVREASQRLGWKFVWFRRGRVLARSKPGEQACVIRSAADIERFFSP